MKRRTVRLAFEIIGLIALALGLVDLYCETRGLPRLFMEIAQADIAGHGVWLDCDRLQIGAVNGIRLRNVTVWDGQLPGVRLLRIDDLRLRPKLADLVTGHLTISRLLLAGAEIRVPDPAKGRHRQSLLLITGLRASATLRKGLLHVREATGQWAGIQLHAAGTVQLPAPSSPVPAHHHRATKKPQTSHPHRATQEKRLSCLPLLDRLRPEWRNLLRRTTVETTAQNFAGRANASVHFGISLAPLDTTKVRVSLSLPGFRIGNAQAQSAVADCVWENERLRVPNLEISFRNGDRVAVGQAVFDPQHRTAAGQIEARITPAQVPRILGKPVPAAFQELDFTQPASVTVNLSPSPLNLARLRCSFAAGMADVRVRDLPIRRLDIRGTCADGRVRVGDAAMHFDGSQDAEVLHTALALDVATGALRGNVSGPIRLIHRLSQAVPGIGLDALGVLDPGPLVTLTLDAEGRAWGPPLLKSVSGHFDTGPFTVRHRALDGMSGSIRFADRDISISSIVIKIDRDTGQKIEGEVRLYPSEKAISAALSGAVNPASLVALVLNPPAQLSTAIKGLRFSDVPRFRWRMEKTAWSHIATGLHALDVTTGKFRFRNLAVDRCQLVVRADTGRIEVHPALSLPPIRPGGPPQDLTGNVRIDVTNRRVSMTVHGGIDPGLAWKNLRLKRNKILEQVDLAGALPKITVTVPDSPLSPGDWAGTVEIRAGPGRFNGLEVKTLDADLEFGAGKYCFRVKHAEAKDAPDIAVVVTADTKHKLYSMSGRFTGDPRIGATFLGGKSRKLYLDIWRDFKWKSGQWPENNIGELRWGKDAKTHKSWVRMQATLRIGVFQWRKLALDSGTVDIQLDLPHRASFDSIVLHSGSSRAAGTVQLRLTAPESCEVTADGIVDPARIVPAVFPNTTGIFHVAKFAPDTAVRLTGSFPLRHAATGMQVTADVQTPRFAVGKWPITAVRASLKYHNGTLLLPSFSGRSWGGTVTAEGQYDVKARIATGKTIVADADVAAALADLAHSTKNDSFGHIVGKMEFSRIQSDSNRPGGLVFDGNGTAKLTGANLWEIPFLRELRDLLKWTVPEWLQKFNPLRLVPGYTILKPVDRLWSLGRISEAESDLRLAGDHIVLEKLTTDGDLVALTGHGAYTWKDNSIDLFMKAVPLEKTWLVPLVWKYVSWFFVEGARCTGTLANHKWRPVTRLDGILPGGKKRREKTAPHADDTQQE